MSKIEQWFSEGITPNELYNQYIQFEREWNKIEQSKKKPIEVIYKELQDIFPIGSYWRYYNPSRGSDDSTFLIKIDEVEFKSTDDFDNVIIRYEFLEIYKNLTEGDTYCNVQHSSDYMSITNEYDFNQIKVEPVTEQDYINFHNKIKSIIELL